MSKNEIKVFWSRNKAFILLFFLILLHQIACACWLYIGGLGSEMFFLLYHYHTFYTFGSLVFLAVYRNRLSLSGWQRGGLAVALLTIPLIKFLTMIDTYIENSRYKEAFFILPLLVYGVCSLGVILISAIQVRKKEHVRKPWQFNRNQTLLLESAGIILFYLLFFGGLYPLHRIPGDEAWSVGLYPLFLCGFFWFIAWINEKSNCSWTLWIALIETVVLGCAVVLICDPRLTGLYKSNELENFCYFPISIFHTALIYFIADCLVAKIEKSSP